MMKNSVLGSALDGLLKEEGCVVSDNGTIATITRGPRRISLEKRGNYWYDLDKNLWFYSRAQIANYMVRSTLGAL